jgi:hypothetical protein
MKKKEKKETFDEVIDKVKAERDYQDACVSEYFAHYGKRDAIDCYRPVPAEILMIRHYIDEAAGEWIHNSGDDQALDKIRKVVAIGIRCLEYHGCPDRGLDCDYVIK